MLLTVPFRVAPEVVNKVAALVLTVGATIVQAGTEATSVSVPKFVAPSVTLVMVDVLDDETVILPLASGELAVGTTRTFCQVNELRTLLLDGEVIVKVSAVADTAVSATDVPDATRLIFRLLLPVPDTLVINTVGNGADVSNANPAGGTKITVPALAPAVVVSV